MNSGPLGTLVRLRRYEERRARLALARSVARAGAAQASLGPVPEAQPAEARQELGSFLAARAASHLAWAAWGARWGRAEQALRGQEAAQAAWGRAASDLRAIERLVERRAQRARLEAARAAQRELDEVATRQWRRSRRGPASRP